MTSVKNADPKVMSMVTVMKNTVGPLSTKKEFSSVRRIKKEISKDILEPVFRESQWSAFLTGSMRNKVQPKHANRI